MNFVFTVKDYCQTLHIIGQWKERIKDLERERDDEIMIIDNEMTGLSHHGVEMTEEQMNSDLPMPTSSNHGQGINLTSLISKKEKIKTKYQLIIDRLQFTIDEYEGVLNELPETDKQMIIELYIDRKYNHQYIADKYGYSKRGMYNRVNKLLENALKSATSEVDTMLK